MDSKVEKSVQISISLYYQIHRKKYLLKNNFCQKLLFVTSYVYLKHT